MKIHKFDVISTHGNEHIIMLDNVIVDEFFETRHEAVVAAFLADSEYENLMDRLSKH